MDQILHHTNKNEGEKEARINTNKAAGLGRIVTQKAISDLFLRTNLLTCINIKHLINLTLIEKFQVHQ